MATAKKPTKQVAVKKSESADIKKAVPVVDKTIKKAQKIEAVKKAVNVAVDKIAAKKMSPEKSIAEVGKSIATIAETKQAKKSVEKITKEAELGRRLSRAKSSLAAGLAAAMKSDSSSAAAEKETAKHVEVKPASPSYMAKPAAAVTPKKSSMISFDELATVAETTVASKPTKPTGNKVSFDQLMTNSGNPTTEAFDVTAYLKK